MTTMWGIHNDVLGPELIDQGFISIGWDKVPDIRTVGHDREAIKKFLETAYPEVKAGAIPVWAGILLRFGYEMQIGDLVVAPNKSDSTLSFGRVAGQYEYVPTAPLHRHRRKVTWLRTGIPRSLFPQAALYEIGSALTMFQVKKHRSIFEDFVAAPVKAKATDTVFRISAVDDTEEWVAEEPSAAKMDQFTRDYVLKHLITDLTHEDFEHFIADLLRAMGYQARVTQFSGDGGVDVIAHRDPLGIEPPLLKVQCKHVSGSMGRPDVQRLVGTLSSGELGLFVTLGNYSREATALEQERQHVRLLGGSDVVELTLAHYDRLPERWRARIPLRRIYVVDREAEGR